MTNSWHISNELMCRCDGKHDHQALMGANRASKAQVYPAGLCRAFCRGLMREVQMRRGGTIPLMRFQHGGQFRAGQDTDHFKDNERILETSFVDEGSTLTPLGKAAAVVANACGRICLLQNKGQGWVAYDDNTGLERLLIPSSPPSLAMAGISK